MVAPVFRAIRSAPHRWSKWEWPDEDPVGTVDVVGGEAGAGSARRAVDVGVQEHDEVVDRQAEGRAAIPIERCRHPASIAQVRGSVPMRHERPNSTRTHRAPRSATRRWRRSVRRAGSSRPRRATTSRPQPASRAASTTSTKFVGSFIDTSALPEDEVMISAIPEPRHGRIRRVINTVVAAHRTMQNEPFIRDACARARGAGRRARAAGHGRSRRACSTPSPRS